MSLLDDVFAASPHVRYVALYREGHLTSRERSGIAGASAAESDRYEELLVNPTVITALRQRGAIDCGGLEHVLVRYGRFYQFILPIVGGHLSVAIEPDADIMATVAQIRAVPSVQAARHPGRGVRA